MLLVSAPPLKNINAIDEPHIVDRSAAHFVFFPSCESRASDVLRERNIEEGG